MQQITQKPSNIAKTSRRNIELCFPQLMHLSIRLESRGAFSISKATQFGSMADFNAAMDKYANSYNPPLGAPVYTCQADLSGTPTITLPVGLSSEGLPLSMQIAGQALSEPMLCRIGHAYEEATGGYKKHPNV